jgi:hypothetical protein
MGTALSDLARWMFSSPQWGYSSVFAFEAVLFVMSALCAVRVGQFDSPQASEPAVNFNALETRKG